jgi:hypothetical protein
VCGIDAEQTRSLRQRQHEAGHFSKFSRYSHLKGVQVVFFGPHI